MADCPLPLDTLPKPLHRHVDPKAPVALRMMGAKGLVPAVTPADRVTLLYFLSFDADEGVRDTAGRTAEALPDREFGVALRSDDVPAVTLDWLADRFQSKDAALELILLNPQTSDDTVARLAPRVSQPLADIVRQNELRLLRCEGIIRGLCQNPNALASTVDGACDFCVRNGLVLLDVPQLVAAHRRVHGVDPTPEPAEDTADKLMAEYQAELALDHVPVLRAETEDERARKVTITQRIVKMSVAEKIKLATLGNKEARTILLRDANKLVCMAAATSPRITEGEIMMLANSKTTNADVLRYIYGNRDFIRSYILRLSLVKNPKVPLPTALRFLQSLQERDIKELARDRNVPQTVMAQAKAYVMKREAALKGKSDK
jgi:hypothetical protein